MSSNTPKFPWANIEDRKFEKICCELASREYPQFKWDLYLKNGCKQDGIDIRAWDANSNKYYCIQCKFKSKVTESQFDEILKEFEEGQFFNSSKKFIVATIADFRTREFSDYLDRKRDEYQKQYNIELEYWDVTRLEGYLSKAYRTVEEYWGENTAAIYCVRRQGPREIRYNPIEHYIDRSFQTITKNQPNQSFPDYWNASGRSFNDIFITGTEAKKICLICDAYNGKTTLLKHLAYYLQNHTPYVPTFIDLKKTTIYNTLDEYIEKYHNYIRDNPSSDTFIILDGLDEVPQNHLTDTVLKISNYSLSHPNANIVFSCRKLFYFQWTSIKEAEGFSPIEILPFSKDDIDSYIKKKALPYHDKIIAYIEENSLDKVVQNAFYLTLLIDLCVEKQGKNLKSITRKDLVDYMLKKSFEHSKRRVLANGNELGSVNVRYLICLQKLALAIQISDDNHISHDNVQKLFNDDEIDLLRRCTFLSVIQNDWSFEMKFFQENIAAIALTRMEFDDVVKLITFSRKKRVNIKWIQTIASYFSFLEKENDRTRLVELICDDNPELLLMFESSKLTLSEKLGLFDKILERTERSLYVQNNSLPKDFADFLQSSTDVYEHLIHIAKTNNSDNAQWLVWKVILHLKKNHYIQDELKSVVFSIVADKDKKPLYLVCILLDVLKNHVVVDAKDINILVQNEDLLKKTLYLNCLFRLIIATNMTDKYYQIGINAIYTFTENKNNRIEYQATNTLEDFLTTTQSAKNLIQFIDNITENCWEPIFDESVKSDLDFRLQKLVNVGIRLYDRNKSIFWSYYYLYFKLTYRRLNHSYERLYEFFRQTNTELITLGLLLAHKEKGIGYISNSITLSNIYYLLFEYEEGRITTEEMRQLQFHINDRSTKTSEQDKILKIIADVIPEKNLPDADAYSKLNQCIYNNDLSCIIDKQHFTEGLRQHYCRYGDQYVAFTTLLNDYSQDPNKTVAFSYLVERFFSWHRKKDASLNFYLQYINVDTNFEKFRAYALFYSSIPYMEHNGVATQIVNEYYQKKIGTIDWPSSWIQSGNSYKYSHDATLCIDIFLRHGFDTPTNYLLDFLWYMRDGFNHLRDNSVLPIKKDCLSRIILRTINNDALVKQKVLENIKNGINVDHVLSSHLELCRFLNGTEITDILLHKEILERFDIYGQLNVIKIYVELGGDLDEILAILRRKVAEKSPQNGYLIVELSDGLLDKYQDNVEYKEEIVCLLKPLLSSAEITPDHKFNLATILSRAGDKEGFVYLLNTYKEDKTPEGYSSLFSIEKISTSFILEQIEGSFMHIFDETNHTNLRNYSIKDFLNDIISKAALKCEDDFEMVLEFLEKKYETANLLPTQKKYLQSKIDYIEIKFRNENRQNTSISKIKKIINSVDWLS